MLSSSIAIWGYSPVGRKFFSLTNYLSQRELTFDVLSITVAANPARDIGGRLMAMTIWGLPASGGRYAAIAGLTAFPATLLAFVVYEFMFVDSSRGAYFLPFSSLHDH